MAILDKLNPKPTWVTQGAYLAADFNMSVDTHTIEPTVVIVLTKTTELYLRK